MLNVTRNKKKKHYKIPILIKNKLSSTLVSQALIDMEIIHKKFIKIVKMKDKFEAMKENVRNLSEK